MTERLIRNQVPTGAFPQGHRFPRDRRRGDLERRKIRLEAQIEQLDARESVARRKRETRANIIIGAVIRAHAAQHAAFVPMLIDILRVAVRRQADKELLASVLQLPELASATAEWRNGNPDTPEAVTPKRPELHRYSREITARR